MSCHTFCCSFSSRVWALGSTCLKGCWLMHHCLVIPKIAYFRRILCIVCGLENACPPSLLVHGSSAGGHSVWSGIESAWLSWMCFLGLPLVSFWLKVLLIRCFYTQYNFLNVICNGAWSKQARRLHGIGWYTRGFRLLWMPSSHLKIVKQYTMHKI